MQGGQYLKLYLHHKSTCVIFQYSKTWQKPY